MANSSFTDAFSMGIGLALGLGVAQSVAYVMVPSKRVVKQVLLCLKCGGKNALENKFCWHCGHPFYLASNVRCPKCGSSMPGTDNYCANCGSSLKEKNEEKRETS
jgi:rRNA maturation endonuclease Nob1